MSASKMVVNDKGGKLVGYARVSTDEQSLDLQLDALRKAGVEDDQIFTDKASAASTRRRGFRRMMLYLAKGDTLVVWRLDRFARNLLDLLAHLRDFEKRGIKFKSLTEALDTETATGRLVLHVLAAIAEFERQLIGERVRAGMKAAKARGRPVGAKPKLAGKAAEYAQRRRQEGATATEIVAELKSKFRVTVSPRLIYHRTKRTK